MGTKVRIKFHYDCHSSLVVLLMSALLLTSTLVFLVWNQRSVAAIGQQAPRFRNQQASLAPSPAMRRYYLTTLTYNGANADTACSTDYHFASIWEIIDISNLKYNTALGWTTDDSGQGPPSYLGWVRTGYHSSTTGVVGQLNCNNWSSSANKHHGTIASLSFDLTTGAILDSWITAGNRCINAWPVWCVEDDIREEVYLPLVFKN
jgi:hypothetical protein